VQAAAAAAEQEAAVAPAQAAAVLPRPASPLSSITPLSSQDDINQHVREGHYEAPLVQEQVRTVLKYNTVILSREVGSCGDCKFLWYD